MMCAYKRCGSNGRVTPNASPLRSCGYFWLDISVIRQRVWLADGVCVYVCAYVVYVCVYVCVCACVVCVNVYVHNMCACACVRGVRT